MAAEESNSLGGEATFAGKAAASPQKADVSLGDERTLGGGEAAGLDTVIDDIEVVDLEARYKIEGTLGQGGMGAVLLATDTRLGRKVAIKRILGEAARSVTAIMRFLTEAKAIAAINHPNIVQIHDYGRAKDGPFLIMEYVDGGSLLDQCRGRALPLAEAIDLACQLCNGLAKAHDLGIVHRDIKPANVLLTKDGIPKLTDFGLAKAQASDHAHTVTGAVLGTPDFMPPEQRRDASEVDHRSDLWSLAATIYQAVTGRSPKIIRFDLLPAELTKVLGKAFEDEKEARYQSSREFRDALRAATGASPATEVALHGIGDSELQEGQCLACKTINLDISRKFCKKCGISLRVACLNLKCESQIPVWDTICGECGGKQGELATDRRAKWQAEAEGLLDDFEFERAVAIAFQMREEPDPRLKPQSDWIEAFLERIDQAQTEQMHLAVVAIDEAGSHEAARDYEKAITILHNVPRCLRGSVLPGVSETVSTMLQRLTACIKQEETEATQLEQLIKERIATKSLDDLMPLVEQLLVLRPRREDVSRLRRQLLEREQKLAAARDEAIARARAQRAAYNYEASREALSGVPAAAVTSEVVQWRAEIDRLVAQVKLLYSEIEFDVAAQRFETALTTIEKYQALKPNDSRINDLHRSLLERKKRASAHAAARNKAIAEARSALAAHDYERACQVLAKLNNEAVTPEVSQLHQEATRLAQEVNKLRRVIKEFSLGDADDGERLQLVFGEQGLERIRSLVRTVEQYLKLKPSDEAARKLHAKLVGRAGELELSKTTQETAVNAGPTSSSSELAEAYAVTRRRRQRASGGVRIVLGLLGVLPVVVFEFLALLNGTVLFSPGLVVWCVVFGGMVIHGVREINRSLK